MQLSALDKDGHLRNALQWLETLMGSAPPWSWNPGQFAAAEEALKGARALMGTELPAFAFERMAARRDDGRIPGLPGLPLAAALSCADLLDECAFSGAGHTPWPSGPNGVTQCRYCGEKTSPDVFPVTLESLDTAEGEAVEPTNFPGVYSIASGGYVGGRLWADGVLHTCATCRHVDCFMHHEPCSQCVIGAGQGGGHADRWEAAP